MDLPGRITLSAEDSWTALMRLLGYALVFFLAFQFGRDRRRAQPMFGWLTFAGLALRGVWTVSCTGADTSPDWLFGGNTLPHDVRSTFINRNHFATWQGLTMLSRDGLVLSAGWRNRKSNPMPCRRTGKRWWRNSS